ncbi:MAG TPA: XRE family transcriptional regulator [Candidatus Brocadiales bacterium]|nr:XRE family transcriptional regulator [Candidatus Brocadiales bacterium]
MSKNVEALVNPALLIWARGCSGLSIEEAAKKVPVKPDRLESWERGQLRPTINQMRKLSNIYKRPMAVFYLPEPPADFLPIRDFRRLPGKIPNPESPQLLLEVRRARERQDVALELYLELEGKLPTFLHRANLSEEPEGLANRLRSFLSVKVEDQINLANNYEAFNLWRNALENVGVLVFQAIGIETAEMRGFSISDTPLPAVVVNIKDSPKGRIFTMLHEFVHIMLQEGGLCDLKEEAQSPPEEQRAEVFCNHVAGAILLPKDLLLQEGFVREKSGATEWSDEEIAELAVKFRVSRHTLLRRLLIFNRIPKDFYQRKHLELEQEYEQFKQRQRQREGFAPPYRMAISSAGPMFIRLALNSYHQEKITASDLSDFLNIKLKHMKRIEHEIMGRSRRIER